MPELKPGEVALNIKMQPKDRNRFKALARGLGLSHEETLIHMMELAAPRILARAQKKLDQEKKRWEQHRSSLESLRASVRDGEYGDFEEEEDAAEA